MNIRGETFAAKKLTDVEISRVAEQTCGW